MSIRKIWAEEAKAQAFSEKSMSERRSKKACALRAKLLGSPSKIPISEQMQTHQRELQLHSHRRCYSSNKENLVPSTGARNKSYVDCSSTGSSDGNLASEIVLSAARHAKNRRSLVKEQEDWRAAVNSVGLPRTSTELGQLPRMSKEQDLPPLSPVVRVARNEKDGKSQIWTMPNCGRRSVPLAQHTLLCTQKEQRRSCRFVEETIPKSVDCAPKVPPRTYLAKLAHAKAHLAKATAPVPQLRMPAAARNPTGAKTAACGPVHSVRNSVNGDRFLPSKTAATNKQYPAEKHKKTCTKASVQSREIPSNFPQLKKPVRPHIQHNPSYFLGCPSQVQRLRKNCTTAESDVGADDEATVLNCSCERCLLKFNAAVKQLPGRKCRNDHQHSAQPEPSNYCMSRSGKRATMSSHHCKCCQFKNTGDKPKVTGERMEGSSHRGAPVEQGQNRVSKCCTNAKQPFQCQKEITKVVEEAVKASIEKLLSMNSIPQLNRARSVESLHEQTQSKAAASPGKYILLSSCQSGAADIMVDTAEEARTDSGIALSHQSCSAREALHQMTGTADCLVGNFALSPKSVGGLERTASLPSLVESSSPAKLRVSTAFIKLVKRVSLGQNEASSQHSSLVDLTGNNGDLAPAGSCSQCSSNSTAECWQTAESHHAEDSSSQSEKVSNFSVQDASHKLMSSISSLGLQETKNDHEGPKDGPSVTQAATSFGLVMPELDSSNSSVGSIPSRLPPDGWERTPPSDAPIAADLDEEEEPSELNPRMCEDVQEHCFSSDSEGSDDQHILEEVIRKGMGITPPIKLPSRCPRLVKTPRKFKPAEMFGGKAKLKLSAYVNSGHVTVHVIRAAKLVTTHGGSANAYVKVSLQPDHTKRAHWRTAVVKSSRNPDFDHKFSFELMPEDTTKRLLVTVWHRDFENKRSDLLGSMSFGMGKILNSDQYVKGWYRLLRQDLGMRRHFAARCLRGTCPRTKSFHAD